MLLSVYLCGLVIATAGVLGVVMHDACMSRPGPVTRGWLAVLAGVLWPVLVVGAVQMVAVMAVARILRASGARHRAVAPIEPGETLLPY